MSDDIATLASIYEAFNRRDVEGVLRVLDDDVEWANGMDGGHERGRPAVRDYWTRQWAEVSPTVEPLAFRRAAGDEIVVDVRQTLRDLDGNPIEAHDGLESRTVRHVFRLRAGKVTRFDIRYDG